MYNPATHTFDDARGFIKAMRKAFPKVKAAPSSHKQSDRDVCEGGALLLYSVRQGLVDPHALMRAVNIGHEPDEPEEEWPIQSPGEDGALNEEYRFPVPETLEVVLIGLNPRLAENTRYAAEMASEIIDANDAGQFKKAEQLIEQALQWPTA